MTIEEILKQLLSFGYTAAEYNGTVQVTETMRMKSTELTIHEIHAALEYRVDRHAIKQIDAWTIVIIF